MVMLTFSSPPENSVPPDVTSTTPQERGSRVDLPPAVRGMSRGQSRSSMLDTADGTLTRARMFINVCWWYKWMYISGCSFPTKKHHSSFLCVDDDDVTVIWLSIFSFRLGGSNHLHVLIMSFEWRFLFCVDRMAHSIAVTKLIGTICSTFTQNHLQHYPHFTVWWMLLIPDFFVLSFGSINPVPVLPLI